MMIVENIQFWQKPDASMPWYLRWFAPYVDTDKVRIIVCEWVSEKGSRDYRTVTVPEVLEHAE